MKKLVFAISVVCYLMVTSGVIINSHYCMNKLASVSLYETSTDVCGRCGMETHESNGCCRDEVKIVKLEQDQHKTPVAVYDFALSIPSFIVTSFFIDAAFEQDSEARHFHNHSPPLLSGPDIYLANGVFRI